MTRIGLGIALERRHPAPRGRRIMTKPRLTRIRITGFRSLRDVTLDVTPLTVLIGPNGAGKSNLLKVFGLLRAIADGTLQLVVGRDGGAAFVLHRGPRATRMMHIRVDLASECMLWVYEAALEPTAANSLLFSSERVAKGKHGKSMRWVDLGRGHGESALARDGADPIAAEVKDLLCLLRVYHFHDTSLVSDLRTPSRRADDRQLGASGGNLAAILGRLKSSSEPTFVQAFRSIEKGVAMVAPGLRSLEPTAVEPDAVRLDWIDDAGERFQAAHLSDGSVRLLALLTALGQPADLRPAVSVIDEPELGLHPAALELFGEAVRAAATTGQVIVATQSPQLLAHVTPDEVVVVERRDGATALTRKSAAELAGWLEDYSLPELYQMSVLGGRP